MGSDSFQVSKLGFDSSLNPTGDQLITCRMNGMQLYLLDLEIFNSDNFYIVIHDAGDKTYVIDGLITSSK